MASSNSRILADPTAAAPAAAPLPSTDMGLSNDSRGRGGVAGPVKAAALAVALTMGGFLSILSMAHNEMFDDMALGRLLMVTKSDDALADSSNTVVTLLLLLLLLLVVAVVLSRPSTAPPNSTRTMAGARDSMDLKDLVIRLD